MKTRFHLHSSVSKVFTSTIFMKLAISQYTSVRYFLHVLYKSGKDIKYKVSFIPFSNNAFH